MTKNRVNALRRIEAVQRQMVRLAEARLAAAEQSRKQAVEDNERLQTYLAKEDALGAPLAKTALSSLQLLARRYDAAEVALKARATALSSAKRRENAIEGAREKAELAARRADEDRVLAEVTEVWFAASCASPR